MATPISPPTSASLGEQKPRGLALVILFSLVSLVTIFVLDLYAGGSAKAGPFTSAPFWLPYLFVILRLRKRPKSALALAIAMNAAMIVPAVWLFFYARSWDARWWIPSGLAAVAIAQLVLAVTAVRAWRSLPPVPKSWRIIVANAAYAVIALMILTWFLHNVPDRITENENGTVWLLNNVHRAASSYASEFGGVYPAHLASLNEPPNDSRPDCNAASLLALPLSPAELDSFESRGWGGEYVFEYEPVALAQTPTGCAGAKGYAFRARPLVFRKTGRRSFVIDQSGVIHATLENRAARLSDPIFHPAR